MGDPKFSRRMWSRPSHPWVGERIKAETALTRKYGLKNKQEVWKAAGRLRAWRTQARELQARLQRLEKQAETERDLLIGKLTRLGMLGEGATLDDILAMNLEQILARRFQSQVYLKGLAKTTGHARQLIAHGHISVAARKVTVPGYIMKRGEEDQIAYYGLSPLTNSIHPMRPPADFHPILEDVKIEEDEGARRGEFRGRRIRVHAPIPPDQADETVGAATAEEKTKDIVELAPEGAVAEAEAAAKAAAEAPKAAPSGPAKADDKPKKPKKEA